MDNNNIKKKPEKNPADVVHAVARIGLSSIPLIGGPITELFSSVITPSLEKRRDNWILKIAETLAEMEKRIDGFKIDNLKDNEAFVTVMLQASAIAMKTHQKEKLDALRNAVINTAINDLPVNNLRSIFLNYVDDFFPDHLMMLKFLDDPSKWSEERGIEYPFKGFDRSIELIVKAALPQICRLKGYYEQLIEDLHSKGLITFGRAALPMNTAMEHPDCLDSHTTGLGKAFLRFISAEKI